MTGIQMMAMGKKLSNVYSALCAPLCRRFEINQTCLDVIMFVANNPEYNTARDICELRGIKSGIASVSIDMLVKKGFLTYVSDGKDRRKHRLEVTHAADELIAEGRKCQKLFADTLKSGITEQELLIFENVLCKIQDNISHFKILRG